MYHHFFSLVRELLKQTTLTVQSSFLQWYSMGLQMGCLLKNHQDLCCDCYVKYVLILLPKKDWVQGICVVLPPYLSASRTFCSLLIYIFNNVPWSLLFVCLGRKYGRHFQGRMKQCSLPKEMRPFMFLVIKITIVDKEGSLFQLMTTSGEGCGFLCPFGLLYLFTVWSSILDVLVMLLFFFFVSGTTIWIPSSVTITKWFRRSQIFFPSLH